MPKNGQFYKVSIFPPRDPKIVYIKRVEGRGAVQGRQQFDPLPSHTQLNLNSFNMTATPMTDTKPNWEGYNGWANYETWNAALWIQNTTAYYETALGCTSYRQFVESVQTPCTGDGVKWNDPKIDHEEMDEMLDEFHD